MYKKLPAAITIAFFCFTLTSCNNEKWTGFFYPDKNDLTVDEEFGEYSSLEACRQAANNKMANNDNADYECGLNCDKSKGKPYICEKTED